MPGSILWLGAVFYQTDTAAISTIVESPCRGLSRDYIGKYYKDLYGQLRGILGVETRP